MSELHLNDLSKIYLEQIAEKKDDSYLETDMKKRQANNEKARKEMEKIPGQKNPHFEAADMSGAPSIKDAKPATKTNVKYDPHMKVMAPQKEEFELDESDSLAAMQARREKRLAAQRKREGTTSTGRDFGRDDSLSADQQKKRRDAEFKAGMKKEEVEAVDEAMSSYDRNRKRAAQRAAERNAARAAGKTGVVPGVGYVSPRKERETYVDSAGTTRHKSGAKMPRKESYDAMAKEYVTEILGTVGPAAAGVIGGTAGAVTGGKKTVKRAVATGTGAAAGAALGGPVGALIGGVAGRALS